MNLNGLNPNKYGLMTNETRHKRVLKALVKRLAQSDHNDQTNEETEESHISELYEFLEYLLLKNQLKSTSFDQYAITTNSEYAIDVFYFNSTNRTHLNSNHPLVEEFELPVALVQLSIIVLVFIIVLFMCKCNQMMEWCRDCRLKQSSDEKRLPQDEDGYNEQMTMRDYFCFLWYNFQKRRRYNKRRRRRQKNLKNARRKPISEEAARKNSLIFKRRSVIYRNKHRKATTPAYGNTNSNNRVLNTNNVGSFSSNQSVKRSVKFRPNTSYSQSVVGGNVSVSMGDELNNVYGADSRELDSAEVARIKKNLSIYFENQVEDIV